MLFILLLTGGLKAQEQYIGLNAAELATLKEMASMQGNKQEFESILRYQNFIANLDTLYETFSLKLNEEGASTQLKQQLNRRILAIDELNYYAKQYRESLRADSGADAQLSLKGYYSALEVLKLKEYFLSLKVVPSVQPEAKTIKSWLPRSSRAVTGKLSYYLGMGLNYSLVSHKSTEAITPPEFSELRNDFAIGGFSRDFYLGLDYQIDPMFSAFIELGWSGQNLSSETEFTFSSQDFPEANAFFKMTRTLQHRNTDLRLGATYGINQLKIELAWQFSFLNSFDLTTEAYDNLSNQTSREEQDPEKDYGFNSTRSFLVIGAIYPVYQFSLLEQNLSVDAYFRASFGLTSILDEDSTVNFFSETDRYNNSLLNLGLRLSL